MSESSTGRRRPACLAAVPLCSRHTHLEHIGEYPAWRGKQDARFRLSECERATSCQSQV
jgi:hypothetical protein